MQTQAPNRTRVTVAALFALSCIGLTIFVWLSFGGSIPFAPKGYEVEILFPNASNLNAGSDVRLAGVNVGKVVAISHRRLSTEATIELQSRFAPLPSDALAIVRNKTLLGESYIELSPGTAGARPIPDGGLLSSHNVEQIQTIDQVLGFFDPGTRARFKQFMREFAAALAGRGTDINDALGNLAPTAQDIADVSRTLDIQRDSLGILLHDGSGVLQALGGREAALQELVTAGNQVLAVTAARNQELTGTVDALPPFLSDLRTTMTIAGDAALQAGPTLQALLPAAPLLSPALNSLGALAPQLRSTLRDLSPVLSALGPAVPALDRVISTVTPFSRAISAAGVQLDPILSVVQLYRQELVSLFANVGDGMQASLPTADGTLLHYVRGIDVITNEDAFGWAYRPGTNRYNPYIKPGGVTNLVHGLQAFDCANTSNPVPIPVIGTGGPPPCKVQGPWTSQGLTLDFPHVQPAR
jgi:phospholipid/cholesterol/gamma-HCH transport system substrate-binding protein